ncbi:hypothetical protein BT96DRAFT_993059 [Gymnopus androsaceus JB14]|uniref:ATP-dependent DNA ligase family profile domain-containing protein n=1 Tax=Gymnopus androsaceus JB14 TaxID=1447944 RepID=A0A6A4HTT1_9AGAR|nr:hypothetical protein BT96DRAFT_993059 [Gymnopus androsaceus JB14]
MSNAGTPNPLNFLQIATKSKPKSNAQRKAAGKDQAKAWFPALDVFKDFSRKSQLLSLPRGTTSIIFRFLFPEDDQKRKFGFKGEKLIHDVAVLVTLCIALLDETYVHDDEYDGNLDIFHVDALLDQLASTSPWSDRSKRNSSRSSTMEVRKRQDILKSLYRQMSPYEAAVLTQIILKDLRPLLYPQLETNTTTALKNYNTKAVKTLMKENAMRAWDLSNRMNRTYRARWDMDAAAKAFEDKEELGPQIGCQIAVCSEISKRPQLQTRSFFLFGILAGLGRDKVRWRESANHVKIVPGRKPEIKIFSKSKRDSTQDRIAVHAVILDCLGLNGQRGVNPRIKSSVILDAEMIPCEGLKSSVNNNSEFWRIRRLIGETAVGIRSRKRNVDHHSDDGASDSSLISNAEGHHLGLVFFDVMYLDDESLVQEPYYHRRQILENLIITEPGWAMLADRWLIDLEGHSCGSPSDYDDCNVDIEEEDDGEESAARRALYSIFAKRLALGEEGLVLKAVDSEYNEVGNPWAMIPNVPKNYEFLLLRLTTFYVGAQTNKEQTENDPDALPDFYIYFTAAYGLSRAELEQLNFRIRSGDPIELGKKGFLQPLNGLQYTYNMYDKLARPELDGSRQYELRWPRITKCFHRSERTWRECMSLQELRVQARDAMGRVAAKDAAREEAEITFNQRGVLEGDSTIEQNMSVKMHERVDKWRAKVAEADKPKRIGRGGTKGNLVQNGRKGSLPKKRRQSYSDDIGISSKKRRSNRDDGIPANLAGWCVSATSRTLPLLGSTSAHDAHTSHTTVRHTRSLDNRTLPGVQSAARGNHTSHNATAIPSIGSPSRIPTNLAGWCVSVSLPGSALHRNAHTFHTTVSRRFENDDGVTGTLPPESVARGRPGSSIGPTSRIPVDTQPDAAKASGATPLQTATNTVQSASHDVSNPTTSQPTTDENTQPGADSSTPLSQLDSSHSKRYYPSPPTSPMKPIEQRAPVTAPIQAAPVQEFFKGAAFWVPYLKEDIPNHGRYSLKSIVDRDRRFTGVDAFLIACRWNPTKTPAMPIPTRGVVFLDFEDANGPVWERMLLDAVENLRSEWRYNGVPRERVPIWVFSRRSKFKEGINPRDLALRVFE